MLFQIGTLVATNEVSVACQDSSFANGVRNAFSRHAKGDWGNLCNEDKELNNQALEDGTRLLSSYEVNGQKIWIITEADRSVTTVLFPHEY
jgi:hypothetical protein